MRWPWVRRYWYDKSVESCDLAYKHVDDVRRENTLLRRVLGLPEMYLIYEEWEASQQQEERERAARDPS